MDYSAYAALSPSCSLGFPSSNQVGDISEPCSDASRHCRGHAQRAVNLDEVVGEVPKGRGGTVVVPMNSGSESQIL
jgi:hypothetical protein